MASPTKKQKHGETHANTYNPEKPVQTKEKHSNNPEKNACKTRKTSCLPTRLAGGSSLSCCPETFLWKAIEHPAMRVGGTTKFPS